MADSHPETRYRPRGLRVTAAALVLVAGLSLLGRAWGHGGLAEVIPGGDPMVVNNALCQLLLGAGLWLLAAERWRGALACGAAVVAIAAAVGLQTPLGRSFGLDELFMREAFPGPSLHPGRMGINSAIGFALGGALLVLLAHGRGRVSVVMSVFAGMLMGLGLLGILSFASGLQQTVLRELSVTMSAATGAGFLAFGAVSLTGGGRINRTLRVALPLGIIVMILASGSAFLSFHAVHKQQETAATMVRSFEVVEAVNFLELCLTRMESSVRGYALAGQPADRAFYERFDRRVQGLRARLAGMLGGDPLHGAAYRELDDRVQQLREVLRAQVVAVDRGDLETLDRLNRPDAGPRMMGEIREGVDRIEEAERDRQGELRARGRLGMERTERIVGLGSVLAAVLALCALGLTVRAELARAAAEAERSRREAQLKFIFATMPVGLRWMRQSGGRREIMVNAAHEQITGVPREQSLTPGIYEQRTHPDDLERECASRRALAERVTDRFVTEQRYVHPDGRVVWASVACVRRWPDDGADFEEVSAVVDITERKAAEAAVRENEERLAHVFTAMAEGLVVHNPAGAIIVCNAAAGRILGLSEPEILGRTWEDPRWGLVRQDGTPAPAEEHPAVATLRSGTARHGVELGLHRGDGARSWISFNSEPAHDESGRLTMVVCSFADVTERRELLRSLAAARDQALEASRLKSEFLTNMSHEIRTPMNGIIGMSSLLLDTALDAEQRQLAQVVQHSAESLLTIINDILDLARIEAGKLRIEAVDFSLFALVRDALVLFEARCQAKRLHLRQELAALAELEVRGDPGRLRQVLLNLLSNAVKFTERGGIRVIARCPPPADPGRATVRLEVHDTGIGIPRAAQARLFLPFTQVDGTITRKFGGTGLGLAISRQLVELMGGEIGFESTEGEGSVFWFELSLPRATRPAPRPAAAPVAMPVESVVPFAPAAGGPLRLLLAEDNPTNQLVAQQMLERLGHRVEIAADGAAALVRLSAERFDAVLMDCQMPELDGYAATRRIRAGEVPGVDPRIPIIALTAHARPEDRRKCLEAGMNDYLAKPLRRGALAEALVRCGIKPAAAAPAAAEEPPPANGILDERQLAQLRGLPGAGGRPLLEELVGLMRTEVPAGLSALAPAAAGRRGEEVVRVAHRLAGSGANLGAAAFRAAALAVEDAARAGDWAGVTARLAALGGEWERLRSALDGLSSPS